MVTKKRSNSFRRLLVNCKYVDYRLVRSRVDHKRLSYARQGGPGRSTTHHLHTSSAQQVRTPDVPHTKAYHVFVTVVASVVTASFASLRSVAPPNRPQLPSFV